MNHTICLIGDNMREDVELQRFATLEIKVEHIEGSVSEIKNDTKSTALAVQSISLSLATLTAYVEQNKKLEPRMDKLEKDVGSVNIKIAAFCGGGTAIGAIVGYVAKLKAFF